MLKNKKINKTSEIQSNQKKNIYFLYAINNSMFDVGFKLASSSVLVNNFDFNRICITCMRLSWAIPAKKN